jgi:hypothetical protein
VNRAFIADRPSETYLLLQGGQVVPVSRRRKKVVGWAAVDFCESIILSQTNPQE